MITRFAIEPAYDVTDWPRTSFNRDATYGLGVAVGADVAVGRLVRVALGTAVFVAASTGVFVATDVAVAGTRAGAVGVSDAATATAARGSDVVVGAATGT